MTKEVTESIYSGRTVVVPLADVQHIEKSFFSTDQASGQKKGDICGYSIITKHTSYDADNSEWANNIYLPKAEGDDFLAAWCRYRYELEKSTLLDLSPSSTLK